MRAVIEVEAGGNAFDRQGRPSMLFEPHVFYRNLPEAKRQTAVDQGLAYRNWKAGNYPSDSYPRLTAAIKIDETAALKAASWGLSQILGENAESLGYQNVQAMVKAFMEDAEAHVDAMVRFILVNGLADDLKANRWAAFARVYNGPKFAQHGYDVKLAAAFRKWQGREDVAWEPDAADPASPHGLTREALRDVQERLHGLGYHEVGTRDGYWGTRTRAAVLAFRADNDMPIVAQIDSEFLATLAVARHRDIGTARESATVETLKEEGSQTIATTETAVTVGKGAAAAGVFGFAISILEEASANAESVEGLRQLVQPLADAIGIEAGILMAGVGVYMVWQNRRVQNLRLEDHRTGRHVGR